MWEDQQNVNGGRWLMVVDKHKRYLNQSCLSLFGSRKELLDRYWLELLMAMVGEQFGEYSNQICGAVLNVRSKGDKAFYFRLCKLLSFQISLWTHDATLDSVNSQIGKIFKAKMDVPDEEILKYEVHKDASRRACSIVKPRIVIQVGFEFLGQFNVDRMLVVQVMYRSILIIGHDQSILDELTDSLEHVQAKY